MRGTKGVHCHGIICRNGCHGKTNRHNGGRACSASDQFACDNRNNDNNLVKKMFRFFLLLNFHVTLRASFFVTQISSFSGEQRFVFCYR